MSSMAINSTTTSPTSSQNDLQTVEQKILQLQNQLQQIQSNKNISSDEKEKRVKNIETQIERLQEQQSAMQNKVTANDAQPSTDIAQSTTAKYSGNNILDILA